MRATAFVVQSPTWRPVLIAPLSLLTTSSGLNFDIRPSEISAMVSVAYVSDAFGASDAVRKLGPVRKFPVVNGNVDDSRWSHIGLVAFDPGALQYKALDFAPSTIQQGQRVWMVTAVYGDAPASQMCHPAMVQSVADDGTFQYQFQNQSLSMEATAGSPLLSDDGALVGVHLKSERTVDATIGKGIGGEMLAFSLTELLSI